MDVLLSQESLEKMVVAAFILGDQLGCRAEHSFRARMFKYTGAVRYKVVTYQLFSVKYHISAYI